MSSPRDYASPRRARARHPLPTARSSRAPPYTSARARPSRASGRHGVPTPRHGAPDAPVASVRRPRFHLVPARLGSVDGVPVAVGASPAVALAAAEAGGGRGGAAGRRAGARRLKEAAATGGSPVTGLAGTLKALGQHRPSASSSPRSSPNRAAGAGHERAGPRGPRHPTPGPRWSASTMSWRTPSRRRSTRGCPSRSAWPTPTST